MSSDLIVIKVNRPLRFFAMAMAALVLVAHFLGQIDLSQIGYFGLYWL